MESRSEQVDTSQLDFEDFGIETKNSSNNFQDSLFSPLASWEISKTRIDNGISDNTLKGSVLLEIKDYKNITQPKQRFEDDKSKEVDVSYMTDRFILYKDIFEKEFDFICIFSQMN